MKRRKIDSTACREGHPLAMIQISRVGRYQKQPRLRMSCALCGYEGEIQSNLINNPLNLRELNEPAVIAGMMRYIDHEMVV